MRVEGNAPNETAALSCGQPFATPLSLFVRATFPRTAISSPNPQLPFPLQDAALCYILHEGKLLLIRKKRGPGAGKVNGPGGKAEPGESMHDAAVRETQEEVCVTPRDLEQRGELVFDFGGDKVWRCGIFLARGHEGEPRETDEAIPFWCPVDALPYDEMWADDREWMPHFLAGRRFRGRVTVAPGDLVHEQVIEVEKDGEDGGWKMAASG